MSRSDNPTCTAFQGATRIANGDLTWVALAAKEALENDPTANVLIFDDRTSRVIDVDFRGTRDDVLQHVTGRNLKEEAARNPVDPVRRPGRPRLGVVPREVTLLPRHWDWLNEQPGGASVTLRRLVEDARRASDGKDRLRVAQDAAYRFMSAMAGDHPGFEEATRALFASDLERFQQHTVNWPVDVRDHAYRLAAPAFRQDAA